MVTIRLHRQKANLLHLRQHAQHPLAILAHAKRFIKRFGADVPSQQPAMRMQVRRWMIQALPQRFPAGQRRRLPFLPSPFARTHQHSLNRLCILRHRQ